MSGSNGHRGGGPLRVELTPYPRQDGRQETRLDLVNGHDTVASLGYWTALHLARDILSGLAMLRESTVETSTGRVVHDMRRDIAGDLR